MEFIFYLDINAKNQTNSLTPRTNRKQFAHDAIKLMKDNNKNYYIKEDLRKFL
jgi:hypothetical protein